MGFDGGKGGAGVVQQIINQIPPHRTYIECFLGDGQVLRAKRPAQRSFGVELDCQVLAERWRGDELPGLTLVCEDAISYLRRYPWCGDEFVYLDPPYLMTARSAQRPIYRCEFGSIDQHRELLALLRTLPCPIAISGYASWLYEMELAGWRVLTFQTVKHSGEVGTEYLWMSFPPPLELHDYRFLGDNFRQRERIKRKRERWKARLRRMPTLERHALLAAIDEVRQEAPGSIAKNDDAGQLAGSIAERGEGSGAIARNDDGCRRRVTGPG